MNVSGSSIAAYYAGSAAPRLDHQSAQRQAAAQQQLQEQRQRPLPNEQVLEGELLEHQRNKSADDASNEQQAFSDDRNERLFVSLEGGTYPQRAINQYQNNSQLDGFTSLEQLHQIDIYV